MRHALPIVLLLVLLTSLPGLAACGRASRAGEMPAPATLPASLDALYPPKAQRPELLLAMVELATALDGVVANLEEGDPAGARGSFARLTAAYEACGRLVPEWRPRYPQAPIDALGAALARGEPAAVPGALEAIGASCDACHHETMVPVQRRYHWGDFASLVVTDPVAKADVPFAALMHGLATSLAGVETDVLEGQVAPARAHLAKLRERYAALEDVCGACHASERTYYVGRSAARFLDDLERALAGDEADIAPVRALVGALGEQSCHRCHLVHVPAAWSARPPR